MLYAGLDTCDIHRNISILQCPLLCNKEWSCIFPQCTWHEPFLLLEKASQCGPGVLSLDELSRVGWNRRTLSRNTACYFELGDQTLCSTYCLSYPHQGTVVWQATPTPHPGMGVARQTTSEVFKYIPILPYINNNNNNITLKPFLLTSTRLTCPVSLFRTGQWPHADIPYIATL